MSVLGSSAWGSLKFLSNAFTGSITNSDVVPTGVVSGLAAIVKSESVWALYKGNGAQMVRIFPYAATQFTSFEVYKKVTY